MDRILTIEDVFLRADITLPAYLDRAAANLWNPDGTKPLLPLGLTDWGEHSVCSPFSVRLCLRDKIDFSRSFFSLNSTIPTATATSQEEI